MSVSRRHAVKMAGMGAASLSLSCGTTGALRDLDGSGESDVDESPDRMTHLLEIRSCGQFVVVEVKKSSFHSYRGRLEVIRNDGVKIVNKAGVNVMLIFPAMRGMEIDGPVDVKGDGVEGCVSEPVGKMPGLVAFALGDGDCFSFTVGKDVDFGRYEYVVLFETSRLERPYKDGDGGFVSKWSHATGGSSSEFIIRRRR
jgi:hypothetical protein